MRLTGYAPVLLLLLLAGCAAGPATRLGQLPLATPRQAALQDEVAAVRIGQFLDAAERDESEMAMLFYQRGLYFSRLGLDWLAHVDFRRAVELRPDFAEAYNQLGVQFTLMGQFDSAYEALDAAIELAPHADFPLLNRGMALHYAGRSELALRDLEHYYRRDTLDPYRVIWLYLAGGMCLLGVSLLQPQALWPLLLPLFVTVASLGCILPNASACAMAGQASHAGSASALLGFLHFTLAALASALVGLLHNGTAQPMALVICGCGVLAVVCATYTARISNAP